MLDPWPAIVVALAAYRITRLIVLDSLLGEYPDAEHPRGTGYRRWLDRFAYQEGGANRSAFRGWLGDLLTCTWCTGVWVSAAAWAAWVWGADWVRDIEMVAAIAGVQGYLSSRHNA
jgi:hypothetical protein